MAVFRGREAVNCEICGVPQGIARGNVWHADGTISGRYPPYIKGTFFDVDEVNFLFGDLSDYLDYDISEIVAAGKYHDTVEYMSVLIEKMREASGGNLPPREDLNRMMLYPICIWGIAQVEFESFAPERTVIKVKNPYSIPLFRGDVAGAADAVTGDAHKAEWQGDEQEGLIIVTPTGTESEAGERLDEAALSDTRPEAGELACERCEACGVPLAVGELFGWDVDICRIEERSTGSRYCYNNTNGITAVLRMLVSELGEELEEKMLELARDYSRSLYGGLVGGIDMDRELSGFPYRGWGKVSEAFTGADERVVAVDNPFNELLLAGRIWGMEEVSTGSSLRVSERSVERERLRVVFEAS
jgi:ribosomal protein S14